MPERDTRIVWPNREEFQGPRFLEEMERQSLEAEIAKTLCERIPRLWQLEFTDSDGTELPTSLFKLMDELDHWCNVEFEDG